ncbi:MAG: uroporphyrinogen decarboxylase family protein [Lachnospiraceae bacterium]
MIQLRLETRKLLEEIERCIVPEVEEQYMSQCDDFVHGKFSGDIFKAKRMKLPTIQYDYQKLNINDALLDYETMLALEMQSVLRALENDKILSVRTNYGTGIMSSLFDAEIFTMPRELNTLPTTRPLGSDEKMIALLDKGVPDLMGGFGRRVFEMGEYYKEVFAMYPKIQQYVSVYHPDTQGPLDVLELLWGSDIFCNFYDEPELVHDLLGLVSETYIQFMEKWYQLYPQTKDWTNHWAGLVHKGKLVIRNDSAMNLSPQMYEEFVKPYDAKLLKHFGGGIIHFCGRGDHYIETMSDIDDLFGINMSQPHLNDMETIYKNTVDKGLFICGFNAEWAQKDVGRVGAFNHKLSV